MKENVPLLSVSAAFLLGISAGYNTNISSTLLFCLAALTAFISSITYYFNYNTIFAKYNHTLVAVILISMFLTGMYRISLSPYARKNLHSSILLKTNHQHLKVTIKSASKIDRKYSTLECYSREHNENIIIYRRNYTGDDHPSIGDTLIAFLRIHKITNFTSDFDYKEYQAKNRCFTYAFADSTNHIVIKSTHTSLSDYFSKLRYSHTNMLREQFSREEWGDILIAILTGEKEYLGSNTRNKFQNAGIIHLMAVSGMHVGLIYTYITFLLGIAGNKRVIKILRLLISISLTWVYCAYTGLSDSSVRAAIMITTLTISKISTGKYLSLNSLCASALIAILIKPDSLFSVGFKLSYLSVLSICIIHPVLHRQFGRKSKIKSYFTGILSISLSCQLGTSIITVNEFGYIPVYFMIGNIICAPLAALTVYLSSTALLLGFSSDISSLLMKTIKSVINAMYSTADKIDSLPLSVLTLDNSTSIILVEISIIAVIALILIDKHLKGRSYNSDSSYSQK